MADPPPNAPITRLDDRAVGERLAALDEQLAQLETTSGPIGELALAAVSGLAEIYGQALAGRWTWSIRRCSNACSATS